MAQIFYPVGDGTFDRLLRLVSKIRCECKAWALWVWLDTPYCDECLPIEISESQRAFWDRWPDA